MRHARPPLWRHHRSLPALWRHHRSLPALRPHRSLPALRPHRNLPAQPGAGGAEQTGDLRLGDAEPEAVVRSARFRVRRQRGEAAQGLHAGAHIGLAQTGVGDAADHVRGGRVRCAGQLLDGLADLAAQLLGPAWDVQAPHVVAEVRLGHGHPGADDVLAQGLLRRPARQGGDPAELGGGVRGVVVRMPGVCSGMCSYGRHTPYLP
ncbi:hypothetical protein Z951_38485 [Streptomyces sp. PRh5]|nr:hypothetical protein Z951_38485 [Streptomyces sp. PRh5]